MRSHPDLPSARTKFSLLVSEEKERQREISPVCDSSWSRFPVSRSSLSTKRRRKSQDLKKTFPFFLTTFAIKDTRDLTCFTIVYFTKSEYC